MSKTIESQTHELFQLMSGRLKDAFTGAAYNAHPIEPHFLLWLARPLSKTEQSLVPQRFGTPERPVKTEVLGPITAGPARL